MKIKDAIKNLISEIRNDKIVLFFVIVFIIIVIFIIIIASGNSEFDDDEFRSEEDVDSSSVSLEDSDTDSGVNQSLNFDSILPFSSGTFDIDKDYINDEYDLTITVSDKDKAMMDFNEWMDSIDVDPEDLNISITDLNDQLATLEIMDLLPVETSTYKISYSVRTEQIVVDIIDSDYSRGKSSVESWFNSQGIDDVSILNVVWIDRSSM